MKTTSFIDNRRRLRATVASAVIGVALLSAPAFAQEAQSAEDDTAKDEIVVTGSLIKDPNLREVTPILSTTAEDIELKQSNVAEELLRDIPGVTPSIGSSVNNGNGGASFVDLRGLGNNRNVVLLDGNRIAPSGLRGVFDLNNVPLALVDRVDLLTGAAVTTYGADAIAGVVNFIIKRDFAGVEFSGSEGLTGKGDGNTWRTDVTIGANFDDGRGNVVLSLGYQKADAVTQGDRDVSIFNIDSFSGALGGSGTSVPARFTSTRPIDPVTGQPSVTPAFSQTGVNGAGVPIIAPVVGGFNNRTGTGQLNPAGQIVANFAPFNFNPFNIFQTPFSRYNMYAQGRYEISDSIEVYGRGLFSKNTVKTIIAPSGIFNQSVTINLNNPFLPAATRNQICAFNTAPVVTGVTAAGAATSGQVAYTPRFTQAQCDAAATAIGTADPNYRTATLNFQRRFVETGTRDSDFNTTIFDFQAGLRGQINDKIDWDVHGSYGQSENIQTLGGYVLLSRVREAFLANNTTSCISGNAACVPLNGFGQAGSITPAQAAFVQSPSTTTVRASLGQVHGQISGKTGFSLPWAADEVSFAVGGEYREYRSSQIPDSLSQIPGELGGAGGAAPLTIGGYDVSEVLGEVNLPVVQDKAFFENLTINAGARYSKYSVDAVGNPSSTATTYKVGGSWETGGGLKLRANYARAVRAPNISELFSPVSTGLTTLTTDPCAGVAPVGNANLRAVCLAQGAPVGSIGTILNPTASQANSTGGGNVNIKPETANTLTVGFVFQPEFIKGLAVSFDFYNIKVKNAITTPTSGDVIGSCFAGISAASATNPACTSIRRNPVTGGLDGDPATTLGLPQSFSNLGRIQAKGLDLSISYKKDIGFADLVSQFNGNYLLDAKFQATPTSVNRDCIGFYSADCGATGSGSLQPKYNLSWRNTLKFDAIDISFVWRHISKLKYEALASNFADRGFAANDRLFSGTIPAGAGSLSGKTVDFNRISAFDYFDLSARFSIGDNLTLTATAENLFDKQPPLIGASVGTTSFNSGNTYPSTYDALGRRFSVGARLKF